MMKRISILLIMSGVGMLMGGQIWAQQGSAQRTAASLEVLAPPAPAPVPTSQIIKPVPHNAASLDEVTTPVVAPVPPSAPAKHEGEFQKTSPVLPPRPPSPDDSPYK